MPAAAERSGISLRRLFTGTLTDKCASILAPVGQRLLWVMFRNLRLARRGEHFHQQNSFLFVLIPSRTIC